MDLKKLQRIFPESDERRVLVECALGGVGGKGRVRRCVGARVEARVEHPAYTKCFTGYSLGTKTCLPGRGGERGNLKPKKRHNTEPQGAPGCLETIIR